MGRRAKVETPYPVVSASQVDAFEEPKGCNRYWGLHYLLKLETPQGDAAKLGDDVDEGQLSPYLLKGRPLDYTTPNRSGYVAASALAYLPPAKTPGLECQKHFIMPSTSSPGADGKPLFGFQGYLDFWHADSSVLPAKSQRLPSVGIIPLVGDFKTTGNWKWKKTADDLLTDTQSVLYAEWAMRETGSSLVDLYWVYMRTKGTAICEPTYLRINQETVTARFKEIEATARRMFDIRAAAPKFVKTAGDIASDAEKDKWDNEPDKWVRSEALRRRNEQRLGCNPELVKYVDTLTPNVDRCDSFGGCPFRSVCNLSPNQLAAQTFPELREIQRNQKLDFSELERMTTPAADAGTSMMARLAAKRKAAAGGDTAAPAPALDPTPAPAPAPAPVATETTALPINPVESQLSPADPIGAVTITAPVEGAPAEPKTRKGRPKGSKNLPKAEATTESTVKVDDAGVTISSTEPITLESVASDEGTSFECCWSEERITSFGNGYGVGPLKMTGYVRKGETFEQAYERTHERLGVLAAKLRIAQKKSFDEGWADAPDMLKKKAS